MRKIHARRIQWIPNKPTIDSRKKRKKATASSTHTPFSKKGGGKIQGVHPLSLLLPESQHKKKKGSNISIFRHK